MAVNFRFSHKQIHSTRVIMANSKVIKRESKKSFVKFADSIIWQLQKNSQHKSWQHYRSTLSSFMRFRKGKDFPISMMDAVMIESYEAYLKQEDVCRNTSSFYMRILRAIYNRAVEQGLILQKYPFRHVYTGIDKTRKRAVPFDIVKQIKRLDLKDSPSSDMAKDVFLMSFYLRGISFIDLAHLKKTDVKNGFLRYKRRKTRQQMVMKWEPQMQALVDKYRNLSGDSPYLFPFLSSGNTGKKSSLQLYHNVESRIAYHLRKIGKMIGLDTNLTLYVARHTWASAARECQLPISEISEALGHDSEMTTQIYLRSIQTSVVDQFNSKMLAELD